nr:MAG TPA: VPR protein [Caudoviricetes sp.]
MTLIGKLKTTTKSNRPNKYPAKTKHAGYFFYQLVLTHFRNGCCCLTKHKRKIYHV